MGTACCAAEEPIEALMRRGAVAERAGRHGEALAVYEKLLQRDTTYEAVIAPRLVDLHTAEKHPAQALAWARRVARRHPDPQAYLAGVYARLGQWKEAELLLRQALVSAQAPSKRQPLLWQLADAQEGQGDAAAARITLSEACQTVQDEALRKTSTQRLAALQQRLAAAPTNRPPTRAEPETEARP
jgi:tetratricopeptide (TPR) repeat protein